MVVYILIGIAFMLYIELFLNSDTFNQYNKLNKTAKVSLDFWSRIIGVLFWPICLGIFMYHFIKEFYK